MDSPSICVASDGRLLYSSQECIFLESKHNEGWLKVYESSGKRMVVSISHYDGDLYFIETDTDIKSTNHVVQCLPDVLNSDGTKTNKSTDARILLAFEYDPAQDVDTDVDYIEPCLSVADGVCFIRYGQQVMSHSLSSGDQYHRTLASLAYNNHAVVLSDQQLWTSSADDDLVAFYNRRLDRELRVTNMYAYGLCRYGDDHLIRLESICDDASLYILNSSGKCYITTVTISMRPDNRGKALKTRDRILFP